MTEAKHTHERLTEERPLGRFFLFSDHEREHYARTDMRALTAAFHNEYEEFLQADGVTITRVESRVHYVREFNPESGGDETARQFTELADASDSSALYESTVWLNFKKDDQQNYVWQLWNAGTQYDLEIPAAPDAPKILTERQFAQPGLLRQIDRSGTGDIEYVEAIIQRIIGDGTFDSEDWFDADVSESGKVVRSRVGQLRFMRQNFLDSADQIEKKVADLGRAMTNRETKDRDGALAHAKNVGFPVYNMNAQYGMPVLEMPLPEYSRIIEKETGKTALHYLMLAGEEGIVFGSKTQNPNAKNAGEVLSWLSREQGLGRTAAEAVLHVLQQNDQ